MASTAAALAFLGFLEVNDRIDANTSRWDAIGKKWEICKGVTGPEIRKGMRLSDAQCADLEARKMNELWGKAEPCLTRMPTFSEATGFKVWVWNIGPAAFCGSSVLRRWNAGDRPGACAAITLQWRFAGGKDCFKPESRCMGLKDRRQLEEALCADKPITLNLRAKPLNHRSSNPVPHVNARAYHKRRLA